MRNISKGYQRLADVVRGSDLDQSTRSTGLLMD